MFCFCHFDPGFGKKKQQQKTETPRGILYLLLSYRPPPWLMTYQYIHPTAPISTSHRKDQTYNAKDHTKRRTDRMCDAFPLGTFPESFIGRCVILRGMGRGGGFICFVFGCLQDLRKKKTNLLRAKIGNAFIQQVFECR